ncbi:uncharacterized protein LOC100889358 [Strongylocentrotus purpuratus]|uniref:Alpha/beta hydrolase fold-5 domain-containing protein n=1 Tax=Strongylocentrotus purpuratus TaxID=7668 RepID=A0A7M7PDF3_STRPU|nr:uncharacterized protein LOC100889358 [Strongylocentrotus purpuratus]
MAAFNIAHLLLLFSITISLRGCVNGQTVILLDPIKNGPMEAGLIVVPGAELRGETYEPLAAQIQEASPLKLHVALTTDYLNDTPNPVQVGNAIERAITELRNANLPDDAPIFVAGHSLGGTFLQTWVDNNPTQVAGMMLWGSYLTGATGDLGAYPTPVMHLCGDLDGQVRITRNARTFRELESLLVNGPSSLIATRPVVLIEGVNHFQFSSGEKPPLVEKEDLPADVTAEEAYVLLADPINSFMHYNMDYETSNSMENLNSHYIATRNKLAPLTAMKDLEWDGATSPWLITAQEMVAGFDPSQALPVVITNVGYVDQTEFESSKPSVDTSVIETTAMVYFPRNVADLSGIKESAYEIAGKMKNQGAIQSVFPSAGYTTPATCKQINEAAFDYAFSMAPNVVKQRYNERGYSMEFMDDNELLTGQDWVDSTVEFTTLPDGTLQVASGSLYTHPNYPNEIYAGMQYCKLMSPHRAMEWIYVDSLRLVQ